MKIRQYDNHLLDREADFSNLRELLSIPFVRRWRQDPGFDHFAFSEFLGGSNYLLMAIFDDRARWYVVGMTDGLPPEPGLIWWQPPEKE